MVQDTSFTFVVLCHVGCYFVVVWYHHLALHHSCTQLLEQALVVEEQLHRAASLGLQHDPKLGIMQLHSRSVKVTVECY